jgi:tetratricopeptide (TPR) repeat protein
MSKRISLWLRILLPLFLLVTLDIWPGSREVSRDLQMAREARSANRPDRLAVVLRKIADREPYRPGLNEEIGSAAFAAGDYSGAIQSFNEAYALGELLPEGKVGLARALEKTGDAENAILIWKDLANQVVGANDAPMYLTNLLRKMRRYNDAVEAARQWQEKAPDDPEAAYELALLMAAGDPPEALEWLEIAARQDPAVYQSRLVSLRAASAQAGRNDVAGYKPVVMGRWLGNQGAWDLAEEAFREALRQSPGYAEAWAFLGQAKLQQGQDGIAEIERAIRLNPNSVIARALAALYWGQRGDTSKAIDEMQVVVQLEPAQPIWKVELGNLTAVNGDIPAAQVLFQEACRLAPDNATVWAETAHFSLTYAVDLRGFGLPAARKAVTLQPGDPQSLDLMGNVLFQLGDLYGAERILQLGINKNAHYAPYYFHLGQVYLQMKDLPKAAEYLHRAAALDPEGITGQQARRLIEQYLGGS